MDAHCDVLIVGGGASGLLCALAAAAPARFGHPSVSAAHAGEEQPRIVVIEGQDVLAKKLLATGNGRCNLSNRRVEPGCYHSRHPQFVDRVLRTCPPETVLSAFARLGLQVAEEEGRLYPRSFRADSLRTLLLHAVAEAGVELHTGETVTRVFHSGSPRAPGLQPESFHVETSAGRYRADAVVLANGSLVQPSCPEIGKTGYSLAEQLGLTGTKLLKPALTPLEVEKPNPRLAGVRAPARLSLWRSRTRLNPFVDRLPGTPLASEEGEVQFTKYGLSGIPAMDCSFAVLSGQTWATVDLLPDRDVVELEAYIQDMVRNHPTLPLHDWGVGLLHPELSRAVLYPLLRPDKGAVSFDLPLQFVTPPMARRLAQVTKHLPYRVTGTKGFAHAQTTHGGVFLTQLQPESMEVRTLPGLHVVGELLDVDAVCGGYNLQWAWSTGVCAGLHLAERVRNHD